MKRRSLAAVVMALVVAANLAPPGTAVAGGHFDVYDTAWELPVASNDSELSPYMSHLAGGGFKGFWISLAPIGGMHLDQPNSHGATFGSFESPNSAYFDHVDHILDTANQHGLEVGVVVGWAQHYVGNSGAYHHGGVAPLDETNARVYGEFLGERYKNHPAIGMWVFGGDYYSIDGSPSDEMDNLGVWQELKAGLVSQGANQTTAYHGHWYVPGLWTQGFFDVAAPLTGHCSDPNEARSFLNSVRGQTSKPVIAGEMRYEDFVADWCPGGVSIAGPQEVLDDVRVAVDVGADGLVYGHDGRWDWQASGGPLSTLGSPGEVLMMEELGYGPGGTPPSANPDSGVVAEGGSVVIDAAQNDQYTSGAWLSIAQDPARGTAAINGLSITYTHDGSEESSDSFMYRLNDPFGSSVATVTLGVEPVNDPPSASDDALTVPEGGRASIDVLANDFDPDSSDISVQVIESSRHGAVAIESGLLVYTHGGDEPAADSVRYEISDGEHTDTAIVAIEVSQVNDPPTLAVPDQVSGDRGSDVRFAIDVVDPEGGPVAVSVQAPSGSAYFDGFEVVYRPDPNFVGNLTLTVVADDGELAASAQVPVLVRGVGFAEPVLFDPATGAWHLPGREPFYYGNPGDTPLFGDWDGDGTDTVGMYRPSNGFVYLRNSNDFGVADLELFYGLAGDIPLVGDWDGDGDDTLAVYRDSKIFVSNELVTGTAEIDFFFGEPGDRPFSGDFDGDGRTSVGLYRERTGFVYFRNSLTTGPGELSFFYGEPSDRIVAGDWDGNGTETVGVFRPADATFYLSNQNRQGMADVTISFGEGSWLPASGSNL